MPQRPPGDAFAGSRWSVPLLRRFTETGQPLREVARDRVVSERQRGHEWEHEVFIVEGEGAIVGEDGERGFAQGNFMYVAPMEWHQFKNLGSGALKFLCLVPIMD